MALNCKNCGAGIAQGSNAELCLYCQSQLTHCPERTYKEMTISVRWCRKKDCRVVNAGCKNCNNYSDTKILPEVQ